MIVQTSSDGRCHVVIEQLEHTRMAGRFAEAWGNDEFIALQPRQIMLDLVTHHDDGWREIDAEIGQDAKTGLPFNLTSTPLPKVIASGGRGPNENEQRHPLCGLLSSMHTVGLYTGRYGLSDKIFVDMIAPEHKPAVEDLLATERGRQERLKAKLLADPEMAMFADDKFLFHNYKLLQFFDTLTLYFNCTHESARGRSTFANVPRAVGDDVTVTVERKEAGVYTVSPFPFSHSGVEIACAGRLVAPQPPGTSMRALLDATPTETEIIRLEAA